MTVLFALIATVSVCISVVVWVAYRRLKLTIKHNLDYFNHLNDIIARVVGKAVAAFLGIKKKGYEVHHCFTTRNLKSFVYLPKDAHRKIHSIFGYKNSMCQWNKIRQYIVDNLIPFTLVENGRITFRRP